MSDGASSRRDFLGGKAASRAVSAWLSPREADTPSVADRRAANLLVQVSRNAMATEFQVLLDAQKHPSAPDAAMEALDIIEQLEEQLSVYRNQSEVSLLNQTAYREAVKVEPSLFELLQIGKRLWHETGGAFDITAGPLSRVWGFHRRRGKWPDESDLQATMSQVGSDALQLDEDGREVRFLREGCEINLGAIGKGWALDQAASVMRLEGVDDFLLHGGKSSVLAQGSRHQQTNLVPNSESQEADRPSNVGDSGEALGAGWEVGLMHPLIPQHRLGTVTLRDVAIGTSGCGNQFFHHQGRRLSHILDPRTGYPAEGVLSATIIAPTATEADALATACYVLGVEQTEALVDSRSDIGAILVTPGARHGAVEVTTLNVSDGCWQCAAKSS